MSRAAVFVLAMIGVAGVAPIAWQQLTGVKACPVLVAIPACNIVLLGYLLMAISAFLPFRARTIGFFIGCAPLFLLALTGSVLELLGQDTCPRTASGIPTCFFSLGLVTLLAMIVFADRRYILNRSSS